MEQFEKPNKKIKIQLTLKNFFQNSCFNTRPYQFFFAYFDLKKKLLNLEKFEYTFHLKNLFYLLDINAFFCGRGERLILERRGLIL